MVAHPASFPELNLSKLKALKSLQIGDWPVGYGWVGARHRVVMEVFSTITSPVFSELVIVLGGDRMSYLPSEIALFETLRAMNEVRPFKLVFLFEVEDSFQVEARRKLVGALRNQKSVAASLTRTRTSSH